MSIFDLAVVISATAPGVKQVIGSVERGFGGLSAAGNKLATAGQAMSVQGALMQGTAQKITGALGGRS